MDALVILFSLKVKDSSCTIYLYIRYFQQKQQIKQRKKTKPKKKGKQNRNDYNTSGCKIVSSNIVITLFYFTCLTYNKDKQSDEETVRNHSYGENISINILC